MIKTTGNALTKPMIGINENFDHAHGTIRMNHSMGRLLDRYKNSNMIDLQTLHQWDRFYRANFINSMSGFKSASLIGTVHEDGTSNVAIFSNIVHLGADPALIGFINRPLAAAPHTITNIQRTKQYTINAITTEMIAPAHQTSAKYPAHQSEFGATGLSEEWIENFVAPAVKESPLKYGLELVEVLPITHNNTFLVIGAVQWVIYPPAILAEDGFLNLCDANIITSLGIDGYASTSMEQRLAYAKH